ncbi:MAG TPA: carboxypeptidase-like regulatory domain-containing protein [Bryobacteraceae bacterium]|jgi:hypothetical protein|nr:carboxypeptidase-like regulatory domain-containing protein [Bryobacteraceae bacterium]
MTRFLLSAALAAAALHAAVIRGVVVENYTGKPLARSVVILQPVGGTPGDTRSARADRFGAFAFDRLPAGYYILKASRKGFLAMEYGQKRWNSAGQPILLRDEDTAFCSLRLLLPSAITGTVLDENDIGLPDHEIAAYRLSTPPELIRTVKTDDRGIYRLDGLEPGSYAVRTVGKQYDDGSYLPTFAQEAARVEEAQHIDLQPETEIAHVDVRPAPGRLFTVTVAIPPPAAPPCRITLASDMGRKTAEGTFAEFSGLPPGEYEVYGECAALPEDGAPLRAGYQRFHLHGNQGITLLANPVRPAAVFVSGAPTSASSTAMIRRKDLAGMGKPMPLDLNRGAATIPPGRWEVMLTPPAGYYVSGFYGSFHRDAGRADGWNEFLAGDYVSIRFQLSGGPGSVRGSVKSGSDPVPGAPVYLEGWDPAAKKRVGDLHIARTDNLGAYRFDALAPGAYRILSTFEYLNPAPETMTATAQEITVPEHAEKSIDLELYGIR